jgi:nucleotide-binding universal stress UspA family protein
MFKRIIVGTDGSASASKAVEEAAELAGAFDAELLIIHAYPPAHSDSAEAFGAREAFPGEQVGQTILEDAQKRFGGKARVRTVLTEGDPAESLVDLAEKEDADVIIVGNKGMNEATRFLLGNVPNKVSHHSPTNVLIVRTT